MQTQKLMLSVVMFVALAGSPLWLSEAFSAPQSPAESMRNAPQQQPGCPSGCAVQHCPGQFQLTPEQQAQLRELMKAHDAEMQDLHAKLFVKEQVLKALQHAANPDAQAVNDTVTEITVLRARIREACVALNARLEKDFGFPPASMPMHHRHGPRGPHHPGGMGDHGPHHG